MKKILLGINSKIIGMLIIMALIMPMITGCSGSNTYDTSSSDNIESSVENTDSDSTDATTSSVVGDNTSKYETTPAKMRDMTSQQIVDEMKIGWNLGNTLDVCNADRDGDGKLDESSEAVDETLWGNVKTTKKLFDNLKKDGINAVRIPITWRDHVSGAPEYTIDSEWMDRVEEIVRYAYEDGMYVIINIHHDGGGDPEFGAWIRSASEDGKKDTVIQEYKAIWEQIAARFQNYSDYLIFESMNEVGFDDLDSSDAYDLLNEFNQIFVNTIRKTGGNNPERHLLIAGYWTDIEATCNNLYKMPTDTVSNKEILSVHYYTPWQFCTTNQQKTWGTKDDLALMHDKIDMVYNTYVKNGVPVLIGEYGFGANEKASCLYFTENLVKYCHEHDIPTFLWDNGEMYDRTNMKWKISGLIEAIQRATSGKDYTITKKK